MNITETNSDRKIISVCIATYKREYLLEKLLDSLLIQNLPFNISLEIIVVDNNSEGTAKKVLEKFTNSEKIKLKYYLQPKKNISITRNIGLGNATGDYICFIDDDETADGYWIKNFSQTLTHYNADGAFGNVIPVYSTDVPEEFQQKKYYFAEIGDTGEAAKIFFTTNAILKADFLKKRNISFEPSYGLTGGEDVHFFERLEKAGAKFIYCKEAITYEYIPPSRANFKYLFNRHLRGGQSFVRRELEFNNLLTFKLLLVIKVYIRFVMGIGLLLLYPFSKKASILGIMSIGDSIGKIRAFFSKFKEVY